MSHIPVVRLWACRQLTRTSCISTVHHDPPCLSVAFSGTCSRAQPSPTMSAALLPSVERCSEDKNIFSFPPPSPTTADPRRGADQPAPSQPVTRGESIVGLPRSAAGGAEIYSSVGMDSTVLEEVQVKPPLSRMGSIK